MNRRATLKKLLLATGTLVTLPTWAHGWRSGDLAFKSIFTPLEQNVLTSVADTIIPTGDTIGAIAVEVDQFLQRLFSDCYEKEIQDSIKLLLKDIDDSARTMHDLTFASCDQQQRLGILEQFVNSQDEILREAFNLVKSETIRGFRTSKEVMINYMNYQIAPGHYYGCVDV